MGPPDARMGESGPTFPGACGAPGLAPRRRQPASARASLWRSRVERWNPSVAARSSAEACAASSVSSINGKWLSIALEGGKLGRAPDSRKAVVAASRHTATRTCERGRSGQEVYPESDSAGRWWSWWRADQPPRPAATPPRANGRAGINGRGRGRGTGRAGGMRAAGGRGRERTGRSGRAAPWGPRASQAARSTRRGPGTASVPLLPARGRSPAAAPARLPRAARLPCRCP